MRVASVAAAILAAAFLPGHAIGLSAFLVAVLLGVAVWQAGVSRRRALVYGVPALALVAMCVVRDAAWIVVTDIALAWILAAVAVSGPNLSAFAAPFARLVETPAVAPPLPSDSSAALRGTVLGGLLVVPFGALFWTADAAFAELGQQLPFPELISLPGRVVAFVLVLGVGLGLCLSARNPFPSIEVKAPLRLGFLEWVIPLSLLNALFAAFVIVQFAVLFGGHDHVLETAGLTYSEYAHEGFWQLVAAAALTLTVVGGALLFTNPVGRRQRGFARCAPRDALRVHAGRARVRASAPQRLRGRVWPLTTSPRRGFVRPVARRFVRPRARRGNCRSRPPTFRRSGASGVRLGRPCVLAGEP